MVLAFEKTQHLWSEVFTVFKSNEIRLPVFYWTLIDTHLSNRKLRNLMSRLSASFVTLPLTEFDDITSLHLWREPQSLRILYIVR